MGADVAASMVLLSSYWWLAEAIVCSRLLRKVSITWYVLLSQGCVTCDHACVSMSSIGSTTYAGHSKFLQSYV